MRFYLLTALFALFFLSALLALPLAVANSGPTRFEVKVNGVAETEEPVSIVAGETISVTAIFKFPYDIDDVRIKAELTYSGGKVTAKSEEFDVNANTTYTKYLSLAVPQYVELDEEFIIISLEEDEQTVIANGLEYKTHFEIEIQKEKNKLIIQDVTRQAFFKAGEQTLVTVVVKNIGSSSQNNVDAKLSMPQLGIVSEKSIGYIAPADDEDDVVTVELPLRIPSNIMKGTYTLKISVFNDKTSVEKIESVDIDGVKKEIVFTEVLLEDKEIIKDIEQGKRAVYKITIINLGTKKQTYTIDVRDAKDWGTIQIDPERVTLQEDESAAIDIYVAANEDVEGEKVFTVVIKSDGEVVDELKLVADIKKGEITKLDPFVLSLMVVGALFLFIILLLIGLSLRSEYKRRLKAVVAVGEAKDLGRQEAKEEAAGIVSSIIDKVFGAKEEHLEVAKERAAGRTTRVLEKLTEPEIEEIIGKAVEKLSEKEVEKKSEYKRQVMGHIQDIIDKIKHRYGEKELDEVINNVTERLSEEEIEEVGVEKAVETLERLREKLGKEIEKIKLEEEEEVIGGKIKKKKKAEKQKKKGKQNLRYEAFKFIRKEHPEIGHGKLAKVLGVSKSTARHYSWRLRKGL